MIYDVSSNFPKTEQFGLTHQIRKAAVSIPSNIAEGYGSRFGKEYLHFLRIAAGSLYEVETQLIIAFNVTHIIK
jgi:four helix bundle protein